MSIFTPIYTLRLVYVDTSCAKISQCAINWVVNDHKVDSLCSGFAAHDKEEKLPTGKLIINDLLNSNVTAFRVELYMQTACLFFAESLTDEQTPLESYKWETDYGSHKSVSLLSSLLYCDWKTELEEKNRNSDKIETAKLVYCLNKFLWVFTAFFSHSFTHTSA